MRTGSFLIPLFEPQLVYDRFEGCANQFWDSRVPGVSQTPLMGCASLVFFLVSALYKGFPHGRKILIFLWMRVQRDLFSAANAPNPASTGSFRQPMWVYYSLRRLFTHTQTISRAEAPSATSCDLRNKHGAGRHWGVSVEIIMHLMFMLFIFYILSAYGYFCGFIGILFEGARVAL